MNVHLEVGVETASLEGGGGYGLREIEFYDP
jgi:hypothetical protein